MSIATAAHCSMMGGRKALPYVQINGIRSDGIAYCALPNRVNASSGAFEADITIPSSYNYGSHAWGSHGGNSNRSFFLWNPTKPTTNGFFCFGAYASGGINMTNGRHNIRMWRNSSGLGFYLDGVDKNAVNLGSPVYNDGYFLVFRAGSTDGSAQPGASISPTYLVIHSLKVWFGEVQVADLIPAREITSNEVCFYNQVDGSFLKNVGGGTLIEYTA